MTSGAMATGTAAARTAAARTAATGAVTSGRFASDGDRNHTSLLHVDDFRHADLDLTSHRASDGFANRVRDLAVNRVRLLDAFGVRDPTAGRELLLHAFGVRNFLDHRVRDHLANLVRNLLDLLLADVLIDGVGNHLDAMFLNHPLGGVSVDDVVVGVFLERAARTVIAVAYALVIDIGAANTAGDVIRDGLLFDARHHLGDAIRNLLASDGAFLEAATWAVAIMAGALVVHVGATDIAANGLRNVTNFVVADFLAHREGDLLGDAFGDVSGTCDLFLDAADAPDLAAGGDRSAGVASVARVAARIARGVATSIAAGVAVAIIGTSVVAGAETVEQMKGLARAGIEAGIAAIRLASGDRRASVLAAIGAAAGASVVAAMTTAHAAEESAERAVAKPGAGAIAARIVRLIDALGDPTSHSLVGRAWNANAFGHVLVARLDDVLAARNAHLTHAGFLDAFADLAAHFLMAMHLHRPAYLVALLAAMLLANLLLHLAALRMAVLLIHRPAHRRMARLLAMLRHAAAHDALDFLHAMLDDRLALGAGHVFPAGPRHGAAAFLHHVAILRDVAFAVHRLALILEARARDLFVDRFANGLVAGMPPLFFDGVIDEPVAGSIFLLTGRIAVLRVAARILTA